MRETFKDSLTFYHTCLAIYEDALCPRVLRIPEYYAYKHFSHFIDKGTTMIGYAGRDYSQTPVNVFRKGRTYIVTVGNFTNESSSMSIKIANKYLNVNAQPHSFNTYIID